MSNPVTAAMTIVTGLGERELAELMRFAERLQRGGKGSQPAPNRGPARIVDGIDFGDGRRWDNPRGNPLLR